VAEAVSGREEQPDVVDAVSGREEQPDGVDAVSGREEHPNVITAAVEVEDAYEPEPEPERRPEAGGVAPVEPPAAVPHAARFQVFTGVLIAVALAAVTAAILVASGGGGGASSDGATTWSAFKPSSDGLDTGTQEIADYVGRRYHLPSGQQIVAVTGGPMELQGAPMRIAVRHSPADGGQIDLLDGRGVLYRLCGLGPKCAIASGKTTKERGLLLQREALELALYSFHDLKDLEHVVVFMPPPKGKAPSLALHVRRGDVAGQLARPLRATLPALVPTPNTIDQSPEKPFVESLTLGNVFKASLKESNQDTSVFLVLDPPPAGT
jgi:hypothetical protein